LPEVELSAIPKLLPGAVTQLCTSEVISTTMNCCATVGVNEVTADSLQALVTGCTVTTPDALIRFT
jgi:hypothetical protein